VVAELGGEPDREAVPAGRRAVRRRPGEFYGDDTHEGRQVRVRFVWSGVSPGGARWEQAFSVDGGQTWVTNWTMDFSRPPVS
jgi:hypothetical protein